ncbi:MAG: hypothetical protein EOP69_01650 [Spirochaetia bacterium]|nr:MAG: hypothetical protein EOP69_01650 [Spirochaetia bacterium]
MAYGFDITLYDEHPAKMVKSLKAFTITVVSKDPLQAVVTMVTKDDIRCDVRLSQDDAWELAGTLATFADMKADHPSIKAYEELEEAIPYGSH